VPVELCRVLAAQYFAHYRLRAPAVEVCEPAPKRLGEWDGAAYAIRLTEAGLRIPPLLHEAAHGVTWAADGRALHHGPLFVRAFCDLVARHTPLTERKLTAGRRPHDVAAARRGEIEKGLARRRRV
jgi:hypothetical protein